MALTCLSTCLEVEHFPASRNKCQNDLAVAYKYVEQKKRAFNPHQIGFVV
jgi:hypothetical protein